MRRPHATIKCKFLGAGLKRERPDALPIAASVRRTNGSSPPHRSHEATMENTSDAREHATTSLCFGGWRRDDREDDDREDDNHEDDNRDDDDRDHGDRKGDK
jgi:hypothetical protein